jgi:hypothetical protein
MPTVSASMSGRPRLSRGGRIAILLAVAGVAVLGALLLPPMAQDLAYHRFADARPWLGIPNFFDVATNLPFLLVGTAGLVFLLDNSRASRVFADPAERWPYILLFAGVALTAAGSAYYHWAPDNDRLVWDRLPMTIVFMSLVAAMVAERVSPKAGLWLLAPLVMTGIASVGWWSFTASRGAENLQPYVAVQFGSSLLVLLIALLFRSRYPRANGIYIVIALYAAAKVAESLDAQIYSAGAIVSGHSVKHLLAAAATYAVLRMLKSRAGD